MSKPYRASCFLVRPSYYPQGEWLERVRPVIQRRIDGYEGEVRFNLMAVIRSRRDALAECIAALQGRRDALEAALPGEPFFSIFEGREESK